MKKRWIAFEKIECISPSIKEMTGTPIECMLLCVDFENETMKLKPFDYTNYESLPFWAHISYLKRPAPKLRIKK